MSQRLHGKTSDDETVRMNTTPCISCASFEWDLDVNFLSDNAAPVAPAIVDAIVQANNGFATAYGDDDWTRSVERRLSQLFEREVAVFLVSTGTAANALALAHVTPPWGAVLCHADSHVATDECAAPEFFGGGIKLVELPGENGKVSPETLKSGAAVCQIPRAGGVCY